MIGCGSGERPLNIQPVVNIGSVISPSDSGIAELDEVTIWATASDGVGGGVTFSWRQTSGPAAEMSGTDTSAMTFIAPEVSQETRLLFVVEVVDDHGEIASDTIWITVEDTLNFTISGNIDDRYDDEYEVRVAVGSDRFDTTIEPDNSYSVDIRIIESLKYHTTVIGVAKSNVLFDSVELITVIRSAGELFDARDENNIVSASKEPNLNLNSLTSAFTGLLDRLPDNTITTSDDYDDALAQIDRQLVLPYATALQMLIDFPDQHPQLEEISNGIKPIRLVLDESLISNYLNVANSVARPTFSSIQEELLADKDIVDFDETQPNQPLATTYFLSASQRHTSDGKIRFNEDGSGTYYQENNEREFNWQKTDEGLILTYTSGEFLEQESNDGVIQQTISIELKLTRLVKTAGGDIIILTNTTYEHYPNGEFEDTAPIKESVTYTGLRDTNLVDSNTLAPLDKTFSFPVPVQSRIIDLPLGERLTYSHTFHVSSLNMNFTGLPNDGGTVMISTPHISGDGSINFQESEHTWQIQSDGHLTIDGDKFYDYALLSSADKEFSRVNVVVENNQEQRSSTSFVLPKEALTVTSESLLGIYNLPWYFEGKRQYLWLELYDDNTALYVTAIDNSDDGYLLDEEVSQIAARWQLNEEGKVTIRTYATNSQVDDTEHCSSLVWDPSDVDTCVLFEEIEWDIHRIQNDDYYVVQTNRIFKDSRRAAMENPPVGHLLGQASIDNRMWKKQEERPIELPEAIVK